MMVNRGVEPHTIYGWEYVRSCIATIKIVSMKAITYAFTIRDRVAGTNAKTGAIKAKKRSLAAKYPKIEMISPIT